MTRIEGCQNEDAGQGVDWQTGGEQQTCRVRITMVGVTVGHPHQSSYANPARNGAGLNAPAPRIKNIAGPVWPPGEQRMVAFAQRSVARYHFSRAGRGCPCFNSSRGADSYTPCALYPACRCRRLPKGRLLRQTGAPRRDDVVLREHHATCSNLRATGDTQECRRRQRAN